MSDGKGPSRPTWRYRRHMPEQSKRKAKDTPAASERDEHVKIDLDPEIALRALLKVDPKQDEEEAHPSTDT
jgi:hypothetical protein